MLEEIDLHVTNRCTTQCNYCCYQSNRLKLNELSIEEIRKVLFEAKELGARHIHITGGEPLIRKDIFDIVAICKKMGFFVRMQTNGDLVNQYIIKELEQVGLEEIMVSLDSYQEKINDINRGNGEFLKAINAIKLLLNSKINVRVNSVITKQNCKDIYNTISYLHKLGVKNYSGFYFSPIGSGKKNKELWMNPQEYINFWDDLTHKLSNTCIINDMNIIVEKGYIKWNECMEIDVSSFSGCGGGCLNNYKKREYLIIRCDGNVYPCIMSIDGEPLGNVFNESLMEIYNRSIIWEKLKPIGSNYCAGCDNYNICVEGCRFFPRLYDDECDYDDRCVYGELIPICPIMKYNHKNGKMGGSSDEVIN